MPEIYTSNPCVSTDNAVAVLLQAVVLGAICKECCNRGKVGSRRFTFTVLVVSEYS